MKKKKRKPQAKINNAAKFPAHLIPLRPTLSCDYHRSKKGPLLLSLKLSQKYGKWLCMVVESVFSFRRMEWLIMGPWEKASDHSPVRCLQKGVEWRPGPKYHNQVWLYWRKKYLKINMDSKKWFWRNFCWLHSIGVKWTWMRSFALICTQ